MTPLGRRSGRARCPYQPPVRKILAEWLSRSTPARAGHRRSQVGGLRLGRRRSVRGLRGRRRCRRVGVRTRDSICPRRHIATGGRRRSRFPPSRSAHRSPGRIGCEMRPPTRGSMRMQRRSQRITPTGLPASSPMPSHSTTPMPDQSLGLDIARTCHLPAVDRLVALNPSGSSGCPASACAVGVLLLFADAPGAPR